MLDKIRKLLDKYIEYTESKDGITYHFEGKVNGRIVIVKYCEQFNQLFCGIEKKKAGITMNAKKYGNKMLKQLETELFTEKSKEKMN